MLEKYENGKLLEKKGYSRKNKIITKITTVKNHTYIEEFYESGKPKVTGYYNEGLKDSIWIYFNTEKKKIKEEAYKNNKLTRSGNYKNNKKNGEWNYYYNDGEYQKIETYKNGKLVDSKKFKTSHLLRSYFPNSKRHLFKYSPNKKLTNYIIVEINNYNNDRNNIKVNKKIIDEISKSLEQLNYMSSLKYDVVSKKLHIKDINITYKESKYEASP